MTFDKEDYWKRRNKVSFVSLEDAKDSEVIGYKIVSLEDSKTFKDDKKQYLTVEDAKKDIDDEEKWAVGALIKKPLRGQGDEIKPVFKQQKNDKVEIGFDNDGNMIYKNRAYRRKPTRLKSSESDIPDRKKKTVNNHQKRTKRQQIRKQKREHLNG